MDTPLVNSLLAAFSANDRYLAISYADMFRLCLQDQMHVLTESLRTVAGQGVPVLVEFNGTVQFLHLTDKDRYDSIRKKGLLLSYAYPAEGQSSASGIYAARYDSANDIRGLSDVISDLDMSDILVCYGTYTGKYYSVVNSLFGNYLILQGDAVVTSFFDLVGNDLVAIDHRGGPAVTDM